MIGQRLGNFAHDLIGQDLMQLIAQLAQHIRGGDQHDIVKLALVGACVQQVGQISGKPILGQFVPIGVIITIGPVARAAPDTTRAVGRLVNVLRIVLLFFAHNL